VDVGSSFPGHLRTLANPLLTDGVNLNQELVNQGWCWRYRKYAPSDAELEKLEKDARDAKKGLWTDPQPVPLWEWRKRKSLSGQAFFLVLARLELACVARNGTHTCRA
jgi:endonuclease YncB( thermonuclease family)